MKTRLILTAVALLASLSAFSQNKGDNFVSFYACTSAGFNSQKVTDGSYSEKLDGGFDPSFSLGVEYAHFFVDNFKCAISLGYGFDSSRDEKVSGKWYRNLTNLFNINPNVAYYVKLADRFYYAPEIGLDVSVGGYSVPVNTTARFTYGDFGVTAYIQPITFEFRINEKWAIGTSAGDVYFIHNRMTNKEDGLTYVSNSFALDLSASLWAKIYF